MNERKTKGYIGIDIGSKSVKIAQIEKVGRQLRMVDAAIVDRQTPWELGNLEQPLSPQSSLNEIRSALSIAQKTVGKKTAMTATMGICDVRGLQIELTSDHAINRTQIESKLSAVDRFEIESRQFDYCPIPAAWRTNSSNVHSLSLRKDWANRLCADQSRCGLDCRSLDGLPFTLARSAQLAQAVRPGEPVVMIDWGYQRTTVCLAVDGEPIFIRMLRGSGFRFTLDAIRETLDVKDFEASQLLQRWGIPAPDGRGNEIQAAIAESTSYSMSVFASELARTWGYLTKVYADQLPRKVLLSGAGSITKNLSPWLANKTSLLVEPWHLPGIEPNIGSHNTFPISLFGPAIALSAMAFQPTKVLA